MGRSEETGRSVNWESDSDEDSSSSESEDQQEVNTEEPSNESPAQSEEPKNPYLVTKGEGSFDNDKTVFVGQLPKSATGPELRTLFSRSGEISRIVIMKFKDTKKPMGSAFIEFDQPKGAQNAIARNGEHYKGKVLRINMANQKPTNAKVHSTVSARDRDSRLVYVGNLNFKTERPQIIQFFKHCGKIQSIDFPVWKDTGKKRGFAMVEFLNAKSVTGALKMDGNELDGRKIQVQLRADNRGSKAAASAGTKRGRKSK